MVIAYFSRFKSASRRSRPALKESLARRDLRQLIECAAAFFLDDDDLVGAATEWASHPFQVPFFVLEQIRTGGAVSTANLDVEGVKLGYSLILQRVPESNEMRHRMMVTHPTVASLVETLFLSLEWRQRVAELARRAFPHSRFIWHPHIPKTGGSSVFAAAHSQGLNYVNINMLEGVRDLQGLSEAVNIYRDDDVIVSGHFNLQAFMRSIVAFDLSLSSVRHPVDRVLSMFGYVCDVIEKNPNVHSDDAEIFLQRGFKPSSFYETYESGFFPPNVQCLQISPRATFSAAVDIAENVDLDLFTVDMIDRKVAEYFSGASIPRQNVSRNSRGGEKLEISPEFRERILAEHAEDYALYRHARQQA